MPRYFRCLRVTGLTGNMSLTATLDPQLMSLKNAAGKKATPTE
jgi:hypothetical protein